MKTIDLSKVERNDKLHHLDYKNQNCMPKFTAHARSVMLKSMNYVRVWQHSSHTSFTNKIYFIPDFCDNTKFIS